jgi:hypothetical protein
MNGSGCVALPPWSPTFSPGFGLSDNNLRNLIERAKEVLG